MKAVSLDQFYTRPDLAERYVSDVLSRWCDSNVLFVEPSAGTGSFLFPLLDAGKNVKAFDIDPKSSIIERCDYLQSNEKPQGEYSSLVVIGNPPFGKNACMAVRFFNHAAIYADEIAFIVPRTFRKISLQKRLHPKFHLHSDCDVEQNAFLREGESYNVPCAWQVWTRHTENRDIPCPPSVDHLINYTTPTYADFAMRRVGFYAGRVITNDLRSLSRTTHYFIREIAKGIIERLRNISWTELAAQTAGVRSLSKTEIAFKLGEIVND